MTLAIDTLAYAEGVRQAGFTEEQAAGLARALGTAMTDSFATKHDLREFEARLEVRFSAIDARFTAIDVRFESLERHLDVRLQEFEKRFDAKLATGLTQLETRLIRVMVGSVVLVSALSKLL